MTAATAGNLPEQTHRAQRMRGAQHGRSAEAEIRVILEDAVRPEGRVRIGSALAAFGQRLGGLDLRIARDESAPRAEFFE
ncbi:plasmid stability protein-like protein [mine drainage metagenome]|uniref:Plasmid stability protein-like protein n=1 Tax=mine drainage metagenome TaxID=410659 RepID=T1A915_9ZZZZ